MHRGQNDRIQKDIFEIVKNQDGDAIQLRKEVLYGMSQTIEKNLKDIYIFTETK